jgi:hypothetical protein
MEDLIKKHLGINTPQWIIDNCKSMLIEYDNINIQNESKVISIVERFPGERSMKSL